ncbi:MAG: DUF2892 domain-containing protein [Rhodospirillales bacterium]|nr:DUF2892 domain-containing protein [Rhodospirillales bacterium]
MSANMGTIDRIARAILGLALLSLVYFLDGQARWFGLIGIVPLFTAAIRWCPAYWPFGISTRGKN